jgi:hypothetical protein
MSAWADLLRAIAALLWPLLAFVILFLFRREIRDILRKVKRGKFFGQELELDSQQKQPGQLRRRKIEL